jgi:hypothetical protein
MNAAPTRAELTQAEDLFGNIAELANRMSRSYCEGSGDNIEKIWLEACALHDAICRIGWMADLGTKKLHGMGSPSSTQRGGAEDWLLSPGYQTRSDDSERESEPPVVALVNATPSGQ